MIASASAILVADEAWVALAALHRKYPEREAFTSREILDWALSERAHPQMRPGLRTHINLHNVANLPANSAQYRMFFQTPDGRYRLFRDGDDYHQSRKGKTAPKREQLPEQFHALLDWYETDYRHRPRLIEDEDDPLLQLWGAGKELWEDEDGDTFIARERAEMDREMDLRIGTRPASDLTLHHRVWTRIVSNQGAEFHTARQLPFTYTIEGNALRPYRNGRKINRLAPRSDVDKAIDRCPLTATTDVKDLQCYAYLFGLLTDKRIRDKDW